MAEKIIETAYAKINLGLRILGKRDDGYHEVSMIMQSVGLTIISDISADLVCDMLSLEVRVRLRILK